MNTVRRLGGWLHLIVAVGVLGFVALMLVELAKRFWALGAGGMLVVVIFVALLWAHGDRDAPTPPAALEPRELEWQRELVQRLAVVLEGRARR